MGRLELTLQSRLAASDYVTMFTYKLATENKMQTFITHYSSGVRVCITTW